MRTATFTMPGTPRSSNPTSGRHWSTLRSNRGSQWNWHDRAAIALALARHRGEWDGRIFDRCQITFRFFVPDRRVRDLDGLLFGLKGAIDAMKHRVFPDDDVWHVQGMHPVLGGLDRNNPRVEITVTELCQDGGEVGDHGR